MDASRITGASFTPQTPVTGSVSRTGQEQTQVPGDQVQLGSSEQGTPKKWLIMNYIAADCNLTKFQVANVDQMELVGSDQNTHIIALVDVGPKPSPMPMGKNTIRPEGVSADSQQVSSLEGEDLSPGSWNGAKTFYIKKDPAMGELNSEVVHDHGVVFDMSHPDTLKNFIVDTVKRFPAEHVALFLNDHGGGHTGAMEDETHGDFMSIAQMKKAISEAQEETGKKLDIIGFDACVMAQLEVVDALAPYGDYYVASQENENGPGWTYQEVLADNETPPSGMLVGRTLNEALNKTQEQMLYKVNVSPEQFAKTLVEVNEKFNDDIPTFSAIDMSKIGELKSATNELAKAIIETDDKDAVRQAISQAENYGGGWAPYRDMRDIGHMCNNLMELSKDPKILDATKGVRAALNDAVIANQVNPDEHPKSEGLSIYAPTKGSLGKDYRDLDFAKDTMWDEALESLGVKFEETMRSPEVWPDGSPRKPKAQE